MEQFLLDSTKIEHKHKFELCIHATILTGDHTQLTHTNAYEYIHTGFIALTGFTNGYIFT
jgi:hypothetical protein